MDVTQSRQCWKDDRDLAATAVTWLGDTSKAMPQGIDLHDGRADLRGLLTFLAGPSRETHDTRWDKIDLSHAGLSGLKLYGVRITDCIFDARQPQTGSPRRS